MLDEPYNAEPPQVVLLKVNLGQGLDCIGTLVKATERFLTFRALRVLIYEPVPPNGVKVTSFMHFLIPAGDSELDIRDDSIITMLPCPQNFADLYREATSSLQIARQPLATRPPFTGLRR